MDLVLNYFDDYAGDRLYSAINLLPYHSHSLANATISSTSGTATTLTASVYNALANSISNMPRDNILRQCISLYGLVYLGILLLYFSIATFSYYYIFDHRMQNHPRYLKNQVKLEIQLSLEAFPLLDLLTLPWFVGDVRGWSMLYDTIEQGPFGKQGGYMPYLYMAFSAAIFLLFTDLCIYWIHRALHIPVVYRNLHKPHHKWVIPTPFASHAFHPVDGYLQSVPYHLCVYIMPIHKFMFIGLFTFVNLWSIFIHDSDMISDHPLENYINGPSHHTLHHLHFTCNYGQYFTWADKLGGSFRAPTKNEDPLIASLSALESKKERTSIDSGVGSSNGDASDDESVTMESKKDL